VNVIIIPRKKLTIIIVSTFIQYNTIIIIQRWFNNSVSESFALSRGVKNRAATVNSQKHYCTKKEKILHNIIEVPTPPNIFLIAGAYK